MTIYAERITHSKPRGYLAEPGGDQSVRDVVERAAWAFGVSVGDLTSHDQRRPLVHYRQCAMAAARALTGASYPTLGRVFDRDHTTVIHAVERMAGDPRTAELVASYELSHPQVRVAL